jgi:hypothetical protein
MKTRALDRWVAPAKHEASSVMSVLGALKFTGGTPMEVGMERLQRTMQWLAIHKEAGLKLDPETAEVEWCYAQTLDPFGVDPDLPEQCQQVGRECFTRSPASDVWASPAQNDPKRLVEWLAFPAGLPFLDNTPETEK